MVFGVMILNYWGRSPSRIHGVLGSRGGVAVAPLDCDRLVTCEYNKGDTRRVTSTHTDNSGEINRSLR